MPKLEIKILEFDQNGKLYTVQFEMLIDEMLARQIVSLSYNCSRQEFYEALERMTKPASDPQTPDIK